MPPRLHCPAPLAAGAELDAARRRRAPRAGAAPAARRRASRCSTAAAASGSAAVAHMGRSEVDVQVGAHRAIEREAGARSAPRGRHAGQRTHGLAGGKGDRAGRRQHPAAADRAQRAAPGRRARRRSRRTGRRSPSPPASSAAATACRWCMPSRRCAQAGAPAPAGLLRCVCRSGRGQPLSGTRRGSQAPVTAAVRPRRRARAGARKTMRALAGFAPGARWARACCAPRPRRWPRWPR